MDSKFVFCPGAGFLNIADIRFIKVCTEYTQLDKKPFCLIDIYFSQRDHVSMQLSDFFKHVLPALNVSNPEAVKEYFQSKNGVSASQKEILLKYIEDLNKTTF